MYDAAFKSIKFNCVTSVLSLLENYSVFAGEFIKL